VQVKIIAKGDIYKKACSLHCKLKYSREDENVAMAATCSDSSNFKNLVSFSFTSNQHLIYKYHQSFTWDFFLDIPQGAKLQKVIL